MRPACSAGLAIFFLLGSSTTQAAAVSPLFARGYNVLPLPQAVALRPGDFVLPASYGIERGPGVASDDIAVETLRDELRERYHIVLAPGNAAVGIIRLEIHVGSVECGPSADRNRDAIALQAYRIVLTPRRIVVSANAGPGLLYGVYTLIQLARPEAGGMWLPNGTITDWPDLELRHIYWDDAHHLERMSELKRIVRQAAFFKVNGIALKLEGHFQYASAPELVEPYALSPYELQELTSYALRYYVQLCPYLDAPAHIAFILKHQQYTGLRAFPNSNYELCATNPGSYRLLEGMFQDLLNANRGGRYFYLSTDEPYYIGLAANAQCGEATRASALGSRGKLLAEFIGKTSAYLKQRGRTVVFWGEYPLKPSDVSSLPRDLVNGEVLDPVFDTAFRSHGIRQMIYTSTEGEEKLFPNYFPLASVVRVHRGPSPAPVVSATMDKISFDPSRADAELTGSVNAGWGDMGLHPETFWLGYATASAAAWHPAAQAPRESMTAFYREFYGFSSASMDRIYQLMSRQAQFWSDSWDTVASDARKPIWGNSEGVFDPPHPAADQTISLPPADFALSSHWMRDNAARLDLAEASVPENDELLGLLYENLNTAARNRYNLEVFLSVAQLCRQNLEFLASLRQVARLLDSARAAAAKSDPTSATSDLDQALDTIAGARDTRNRVYWDIVDVWSKSWLPRVPEANGRRFLHEMDDVKDHLPDRTVDMSYLIYRQLLLPVDGWASQILADRNRLAASVGQPARRASTSWLDTTVASVPRH